MINVFPMKSGKPGDRMLDIRASTLVYEALRTPTTNYAGRPVHAVGLQVDDDDLDAVRAAMVDTFRGVFPNVAGEPRLPIRPNKNGTTLIWLEADRLPPCLDAKGQPITPPMAGATVKTLSALCPYRRSDTEQGVGAYLRKLKVL